MRLLKTNDKNIQNVLACAVDILTNGGVIAYPTDTFYGLGVKFDMDNALRRLYEIKQRPKDKAMPLIIGERSLLSMIASEISSAASALMEKFWPGPLTLILPARENVSEHITAGTHTVAVRIPGESFALRLAQTAHFPITATSANPSGLLPARDAETILRYFGNTIDLIIDGGLAPGDAPSTIVDVTGYAMEIRREGAIKKNLLAF